MPAQDTPSTLVMVGASHRSAPLPVLERLFVPASELPVLLEEVLAGAEVTGVIVLSTCNRTELYASCRRFHGGVEELAGVLAARAGLAIPELVPHLTVLHGDAALTHLFQVAAGAESLAVGETEILGQVQRALDSAQAHGATTPLLARAFGHAVRTGRRARAETGIAAGAASLPGAAVRRAEDHAPPRALGPACQVRKLSPSDEHVPLTGLFPRGTGIADDLLENRSSRVRGDGHALGSRDG